MNIIDSEKEIYRPFNFKISTFIYGFKRARIFIECRLYREPLITMFRKCIEEHNSGPVNLIHYYFEFTPRIPSLFFSSCGTQICHLKRRQYTVLKLLEVKYGRKVCDIY